MNTASLYVHFPFCESKCHYCDFYSLGRERTRPEDPDAFEQALKREAEGIAESLAPRLDTVFFGGGTPSMTPARSMERALGPLNLPARVTSGTEWTMEANPSSVNLSSLREYRAFGVNRISMGIQALRPELLSSMGRVHDREAAIEALDSIFEAGFENVSVDLLCGVPGQTQDDLREAIDRLLGFPITHLSCYLLTLPSHHRMHRRLPDEEEQLEHLLLIDSALRARGFEHYEISNFARPGHRARHNLAYWKGASYLGLGPSAHSFDAAAGERWKNLSSLQKYCSALEAGESVIEQREHLTPKQENLERWLLALRLDEGFPSHWLTTPHQIKIAEQFQNDGLLEPHPQMSGRLRLTARGFALSDGMITALSS